jgi:hypothetical protein
MKRISNFLVKISTGWVTLIGLVIFLLFSVLVLPSQSSQTDSPNDEIGSPDLSFYYSTDQLYAMAETYGEDGRSEYIRARFTFDLIWPIVYGFFLSTAISWLFSKFNGNPFYQAANLFPILGVLFDYLENLSTSLVMHRYPARTAVIDFLAPIFTSIKWIFVGGSFIVLMIGLIGWVLSVLRKPQK